MSDPAWDLGYLASEAEFDSVDVARLARAYCDAEMTRERISAAALVAGAISFAWVALQMRAQPSPGIAETIAARRTAIDRLAALNAEF